MPVNWNLYELIILSIMKQHVSSVPNISLESLFTSTHVLILQLVSINSINIVTCFINSIIMDINYSRRSDCEDQRKAASVYLLNQKYWKLRAYRKYIILTRMFWKQNMRTRLYYTLAYLRKRFPSRLDKY